MESFFSLPECESSRRDWGRDGRNDGWGGSEEEEKGNGEKRIMLPPRPARPGHRHCYSATASYYKCHMFKIRQERRSGERERKESCSGGGQLQQASHSPTFIPLG